MVRLHVPHNFNDSNFQFLSLPNYATNSSKFNFYTEYYSVQKNKIKMYDVKKVKNCKKISFRKKNELSKKSVLKNITSFQDNTFLHLKERSFNYNSKINLLIALNFTESVYL